METLNIWKDCFLGGFGRGVWGWAREVVRWGGENGERRTGLNNNGPDPEHHLLSGRVPCSLQSSFTSLCHLVPAQLCDEVDAQGPTAEPQHFR